MTVNVKWLSKEHKNRSTLFYFTKAEHALTNLQHRRVKVSSFSKCNDLFELASFSMKSSEVRKEHEEWLQQVESNFGLICFSFNWRHPLMWAHYANNGSGVCMVFSVANECFTSVEYIPDREKRGENFSFPRPQNDSIFFDFCSKKFSAWRYEQEARMFCNLRSMKGESGQGDIVYKNFSHELKPLGIIKGPRPQLSQAEILDASDTPIQFFQCRAAFSKYEMVVQQSKKRWYVK
ncbi:DUF2971 domain-containing protein [Roseovarius faecimaris]|uniref:DUF2971 domain-containing protein n=1 Tax=Roseovarius faecimaris TaxID=2494550 RepID=A0A6I6IS27_9RHOB|nr:DUF2971 domain-containing protein [Roseovarius faecimaris]QGY00001.1 DUF2971 domain-containing protein [Roseovarius faecimaris]